MHSVAVVGMLEPGAPKRPVSPPIRVVPAVHTYCVGDAPVELKVTALRIPVIFAARDEGARCLMIRDATSWSRTSGATSIRRGRRCAPREPMRGTHRVPHRLRTHPERPNRQLIRSAARHGTARRCRHVDARHRPPQNRGCSSLAHSSRFASYPSVPPGIGGSAEARGWCDPHPRRCQTRGAQ